jgi:hypothetical protein
MLPSSQLCIMLISGLYASLIAVLIYLSGLMNLSVSALLTAQMCHHICIPSLSGNLLAFVVSSCRSY